MVGYVLEHFDIELLKQVENGVDYFLMMVQKYRGERSDGGDKEIRASIGRADDASPSLRNKKDLTEAFVDSVSASGSVDADWRALISAKRELELDAIIKTEGLRPAETRAFMARTFRDGAVNSAGTTITKVLPPVSRFIADGGHREMKQRLIVAPSEFFERYLGLGVSGPETMFTCLATPIAPHNEFVGLRCSVIP